MEGPIFLTTFEAVMKLSMRLRKVILAGALMFSGGLAFAQKAPELLPYQKHPTLPAFYILLQDSSTIFNTYYIEEGRPTVLMFFSPDCEHCQQFTKGLIEHMDSLKEVQFFLFTPMSLAMLRPFAEKMKLKNYKNMMVGKDYQFFFPQFYGAKYVPYIAVYDRQKKFVKMFEGNVKIEELMKVMRNL